MNNNSISLNVLQTNDNKKATFISLNLMKQEKDKQIYK